MNSSLESTHLRDLSLGSIGRDLVSRRPVGFATPTRVGASYGCAYAPEPAPALRLSPGFNRRKCLLMSLMMSSFLTFRLKRRRALSMDSPSRILTSAMPRYTPSRLDGIVCRTATKWRIEKVITGARGSRRNGFRRQQQPMLRRKNIPILFEHGWGIFWHSSIAQTGSMRSVRAPPFSFVDLSVTSCL